HFEHCRCEFVRAITSTNSIRGLNTVVCYRPLCSGKASSSSCCTKSHVDTTSTCYLFCIIIPDPSSQSSTILYDLISLLRDARHIGVGDAHAQDCVAGHHVCPQCGAVYICQAMRMAGAT